MDAFQGMLDAFEPGPVKDLLVRTVIQLKALAERQDTELEEAQGKILDANNARDAAELKSKKLQNENSFMKVTADLIAAVFKQEQIAAKETAKKTEVELKTSNTAEAHQDVSNGPAVFRAEPYVSVLVDIDAECYHPRDLGYNSGKRFAEALLSDVHDSLEERGLSVGHQNIKIELFYNEKGATRQFGSRLKTCLEDFAKSHPLFRLSNAGGHKEAADHMIRETLRHELSQKNCAAIFLCLGHDGGYFAVLQTLDLVSSARHRIYLVEPRDAIWAKEYKNLNLTRFRFSRAFDEVVQVTETPQPQLGVAQPSTTTSENNHQSQDADDGGSASSKRKNAVSTPTQRDQPFNDGHSVALHADSSSVSKAEAPSSPQSTPSAVSFLNRFYSSLLPSTREASTNPQVTEVPSTDPTITKVTPAVPTVPNEYASNSPTRKVPAKDIHDHERSSTKPPVISPPATSVPFTKQIQTPASVAKPSAPSYKQLPNDFGSTGARDLGFAIEYDFDVESHRVIPGCKEREPIGQRMAIDKNGNRLDIIRCRPNHAKFYGDVDRLCPVKFLTGYCTLDNRYHLRQRHDAEGTMDEDKWEAYRFFAACKPCEKGPSCRDRWCYRGHHPRHLCQDQQYKVKWVLKEGLEREVTEKIKRDVELAKYERLDKELVWLEKR